MKHYQLRTAKLIVGIALSAFFILQTRAGAQLSSIKPEKTQLQVGTAGSGTTSLPLFVAFEGGYFAKRGLNVSIGQVGATVAVQGVISGNH